MLSTHKQKRSRTNDPAPCQDVMEETAPVVPRVQFSTQVCRFFFALGCVCTANNKRRVPFLIRVSDRAQWRWRFKSRGRDVARAIWPQNYRSLRDAGFAVSGRHFLSPTCWQPTGLLGSPAKPLHGSTWRIHHRPAGFRLNPALTPLRVPA